MSTDNGIRQIIKVKPLQHGGKRFNPKTRNPQSDKNRGKIEDHKQFAAHVKPTSAHDYLPPKESPENVTSTPPRTVTTKRKESLNKAQPKGILSHTQQGT